MDSYRCKDCPLRDSPYVPGAGAVKPDGCVFVVGTAPGEIEEKTQKCFAGDAGELVRTVVGDLGLEERVYFTNVIKRRPVSYDGENRKPSKRECWKCGSHLMEELAKFRPRAILALGQMPLEFFLGRSQNVQKIHGLPIHLIKFQLVMKLVPTYDPSFVMRRGGLSSRIGNEWVGDLADFADIVKNEAWE